MAEVQPFRGWRYDVSQVGSLSDVVAPPYDVINADQQKGLYEAHPCNVIRLELNRDEPGDDTPQAKYERATGFLRRWQQDGILAQDREPCVYVYHQEFEWEGKTFVRKGFMGRIRVEEFGKGKVFPHEHTLSGPKMDRLHLLRATKTNLSPIFGLFPDPTGAVQAPLEAALATTPPLQATDHLGVVHKFWPVHSQAAISAMQQKMIDLPIFIADGHHRYETAVNYRNELKAAGKLGDDNAAANFVMMMFIGMSDPGLVIMPTHRLVSGLPNLTTADLKAALGSHFELESTGKGTAGATEAWGLVDADGGQNVFGLGTVADDEWLFARCTDDSPMAKLAADQTPAWRALGVSILHKLILEHLIKTKFPGEQKFQYVHLLDEVTDAAEKKTCQLACLVPPAQISHVQDIASKLEKMPPKSTYFYPKLLSGLVFHSVE